LPPYDLTHVAREVVLEELAADSAVEGWVEDGNPVGSEEEDALLVLEHAQEDTHHGVSLDVGVTPLFQLDVSFVQQKYSVPGIADLQDFL